VVQGEKRFRVVEFLEGWPFLVASVAWIPEPQDTGPEIEARFLQLKGKAVEAIHLLPSAPDELANVVQRLRRARGVDDKHHLTLMCRDLSEIAAYAIVDNVQFRMLRLATPGSYTFILRATKEVPRRLQHPKRRTIGVRVPAHVVTQALLAELGEPMLSATLILPGASAPLAEAAEIRAALEHELDVVVDCGPCGTEPSTVIDLTGAAPVVLRKGRGPLEIFGLGAPL